MAQKNSNLHQAKRVKNDEFYTLLTDIEKEMNHYKPYFKGKTILCNCDDVRKSNFFVYFSNNFESLGIKKLITTGYDEDGRGVVFEYEGDKNGNLMVDPNEIKVTELKGNGDFRSEECVEYLKQADIVITNPPFSLFRDFIALLFKYNKDFIIIGNQNAITYKEVFPYIMENRLWLGNNYVKEFVQPDGTRKKFGNILWYTNIPHKKRNLPMDFYKTYNEKEFPKYDNYDAINVDKTCDIPMDYYGVMGVPITFLDKYCPAQFEIVRFRKGNDDKDLCVNGKCPYFRVLIRRKSADK